MATSIPHSKVPLGHVHPIVNWIFDDAPQLDSFTGVTATDLHKVAFVESAQQYFAPVAIDAGSGDVTWVALGADISSLVTNLSYIASPVNGTVVSSTGTDAVIPLGDGVNAGLQSPAHYNLVQNFTENVQDLMAVTLVAGSNVSLVYSDIAGTITISTTGGSAGATNLSVTDRTATTLTVASDTGTDAVIPEASTTEAGLLNAADKVKLNGQGTAATRNVGTGATDLPDTTQLNARLGTTGNLGTMAQQNATTVAITGGNINGTSIGATTRAAGNFTTVALTSGIKVGNAANADPLVMDWYEEGNCLPTVTGRTVAGAAASYPVRTGSYTRRGNRVEGQFEVSYTGHTGSGGMIISGLPYPVAKSSACSLQVSAPFTAGYMPSALVAATAVNMYETPPSGAIVYHSLPAAGSYTVDFSYEV